MRSSSNPCRAGLRGCLALAVAVAVAAAPPSFAGEAPRRRLESAGGARDDVVPLAVDRAESRWQSAAVAGEAGREITVPTRSIVGWGLWPPVPQGPIVLLSGGGLIAGRIEAADAATVTVRSATFGRLVLPAAGVVGWRAGASIDPGPLDSAGEVAGGQATILLDNGDVLMVRQVDWRDGRLGIIRRSGSVILPEGVVLAVDFARPASAGAPGDDQPRIFAAVADGSWVEVESLATAHAAAEDTNDPRRIAIVTSARLGSQAAECFATEVVALAVDGGAATRLALRDPVAFAQSPLLTEQRGWPLASGCTVTGGWPMLRGAAAGTALGMHAPARVRYAVPAAGGRFEARVGIDDTAGGGGSVLVRVRTDSAAGAGHDAFTSPILRGNAPPLDLRVDLGTAQEVELVVEPADGGDVLDRVLWLDPRVVVPEAR